MVLPLAAVLGAAGTIGSTLLGGMMASSEAKRAQQYAAGGLRRTVSEARALGIHPAVALGSPVSAAMATPVQSTAPDIVASGGSRAAEQLAAGFDPVTKAQLGLLAAQTRQADASAADMLASARSRSLAAAATAIAQGGAPPTPSTIVGPLGTQKLDHFTDAATVGKEYGDIAKEGYGLARLVNKLMRDNFGPSMFGGSNATKRRPAAPGDSGPNYWEKRPGKSSWPY